MCSCDTALYKVYHNHKKQKQKNLKISLHFSTVLKYVWVLYLLSLCLGNCSCYYVLWGSLVERKLTVL